MSNEQMKYLLEGCIQMHCRIIESAINDMTDTEFNEMPTIAMTSEENSVIERYGNVFCRIKGSDKDFESCKVYSFGSYPFRIKIKEQ